MIKFFRKIRQRLLTDKRSDQSSRAGRYMFYAIGEIVLVMIGILLALQVNNWNQNRKNAIQEQFILEHIQLDLESDMDLISYQIDKASSFIEQYKFCTEVLLDERQSTREEFIENLSSILTILYFDQNRTTFDNIVSSGKMEYIQNQILVGLIIKYYSDGGNIGWDSFLIDYTRNIFAPYMMSFDHNPQVPQTSYRANASKEFTEIDYSRSRIKPQSIEDYKNDVFILNMLRTKIYAMEGQLMEYENLKKTIFQLLEQVSAELEKNK